MANSASPSPPVSASMWPASARSARLPDQSAPATSTTRNPHVSARVTVRRPRERAAAVCRCGRASIARTWDEEAAALAARYRVLALDQRGHGDSDPSPNAYYTVATMSADVAALADSLGLDRVSIVGLSMGGRVAIAVAGTAPRRVERLVIVDIGPDISEAGLVRVGTLMARSPELFPSLEHALAFHRVTNPLYTEAMLRHRVQHGTRAVEGGLTWKYDRGLREAVRAGTWSDPIELWPLWRRIVCPILLGRGPDSDVPSVAYEQRMLNENPNTRFAAVAGAGHTVPGDQPAAFQRLLTDFLAD